jgi:hypothetical protein
MTNLNCLKSEEQRGKNDRSDAAATQMTAYYYVGLDWSVLYFSNHHHPFRSTKSEQGRYDLGQQTVFARHGCGCASTSFAGSFNMSLIIYCVVDASAIGLGRSWAFENPNPSEQVLQPVNTPKDYLVLAEARAGPIRSKHQVHKTVKYILESWANRIIKRRNERVADDRVTTRAQRVLTDIRSDSTGSMRCANIHILVLVSR